MAEREKFAVLTVDERWPTTTVNGLRRPVTLQL